MSKKILVTGGTGLLGKELQKLIPEAQHCSSSKYDLTNQSNVEAMFRNCAPDIVIHMAAKVGGIIDNVNKPCTYIEDNLLINTYVIKYARETKVEDLLAISSTCVYPRSETSYPMQEFLQLHGTPEETNIGYAYAKRAMIMQINSSNNQYGTNYKYIIPCNLYGTEDNFQNLNKAHFITALVQKIFNAVKNGDDHITLFGTGRPLRQFIHARDVAHIIVNLLKVGFDKIPKLGLNIASDECYSIQEMATIATEATGNQHLKIEYDITKPDGVYRKDVSNKKLMEIFPYQKFTLLKEGILEVYENLKRYDEPSK